MLRSVLRRPTLKCLQLNKQMVGITRNPLISPTVTLYGVNRRYSSENTDSDHLYENLNPFGRLEIRCLQSSDIAFKVTSVDPQEFPDQSRASVATKFVELQCRHIHEDNTLVVDDGTNEQTGETQSGQCRVQVPIIFDVRTRLSGRSSLELTNLENQLIDVTMEQGNCHLGNVKTGEFSVNTTSGDIVSEKIIQGNGSLQTDSGDVTLHKPLCRNLSIQTSSGRIAVTNLYADVSDITTRRGNVTITNSHMHANVKVMERADVSVESVSGSLNVTVAEGNINVTTTQHDVINLHTGRGDITVTIPRTLTTGVSVKGHDIQLADGMVIEDATRHDLQGGIHLQGVHEGTEKQQPAVGKIHAQTDAGVVYLKQATSGWFSHIQEKYNVTNS